MVDDPVPPVTIDPEDDIDFGPPPRTSVGKTRRTTREDAATDGGAHESRAATDGGDIDVEIVVFRKSKSDEPLSKVIQLVDGKPSSDSSQCRMVTGLCRRWPVKSLDDFASLINTKLTAQDAIALGAMNDGLGVSLGAKPIVVTAQRAAKDGFAPPNFITRTKENIAYRAGRPAFVLFDFDLKGQPADVKDRIAALGGLEPALASVMPELMQAGRVVRLSTSAGLYNVDTGEEYPASGGMHIYVLVANGADATRFLATMQKRLWLAGLGWHVVSRAGSLLERSPVDTAVSDGARLVFEGGPIVTPPLAQHPRPAVVFDGPPLDTLVACPPLTATETSAFNRLLAESRKRLKPECAKQRRIFKQEYVANLIGRGVNPEAAREAATALATRQVLLPTAMLEFDDPSLGVVTVADVLADPKRFAGKTLRDPIEGHNDRANRAIVTHGGKKIFSHVHGGVIYTLGHDTATKRAGVETSADDSTVETESRAAPRRGKRVDPPGGDEEPTADFALVATGSCHKAGDGVYARCRSLDPAEAMELINKEHCFVLESGKATVMRRVWQPQLGHHAYDRLTTHDFCATFTNRFVAVPTANGGVKYVPLGKFWLANPIRRQCLGGVILDPSNQAGDEYLNLWEGFAVEPRKGTWRLMRRHIWNIICGKNKTAFKYVVRWMARAVQHPELPGYTVIVTRGGEGTGKGLVGATLVKLFGAHGLHIVHAEHLVGRFNGFLQRTVALFADEAFFAGDKKHVSVLKAIVTEEMMAIEEKFRAIFQGRNFLHIFMASNNDWVVPASLDARRFVVFDVDNEKQGDRQYFKAILREREHGGLAAMLYDLQRVDLTAFDVTDIPKTEGLKRQKTLSLDPCTAWMFEVLHRGYVYESKHGLPEFLEWRDDLSKDLWFKSYVAYANSRRDRHTLNREDFGRRLLEMGVDGTRRTRHAVIGEGHARGVSAIQIADEDGDTKVMARFAFEPIRTQPGSRATPIYQYGPTLAEAREKFAQATGLTPDWGDDGKDVEILDDLDQLPF
ncbi:primase-helicase family protein [Methylocystis sp. ATCC 49242]|uniref:primase-helicase family protein n=1 Tax=Methylocystis sp. ATCC 49242 TaxID=622637 RepID=UPI0001F8686F|nr:primase-helicase family protein [Methylocystis sp. ATCC 49242]